MTNTKRQREERLTEALRSNLARRKAQARERLANDLTDNGAANQARLDDEASAAMQRGMIS